MKKYIKPAIIKVALDNESLLVGSLGNTGRDYNPDDESYGRGFDLTWDDEDEK